MRKLLPDDLALAAKPLPGGMRYFCPVVFRTGEHDKKAYALVKGQAEEFQWMDNRHHKNVKLRVTPDRTPRESKIMATYHSLQGSLEEFINDPNNTFDTNLVERVKTNSIRGPLELALKTGDVYATFKVFLKDAQDAP